MRKPPLLLGALMLPLLAVPFAAPLGAKPRVHIVVMAKMRFAPMPAGIRAGDAILWVNRDPVPHTATARDRSFNVDLAAGESRKMVVRRAGSFPFYCRYHPGMKATLTAAAP